MKAIPIIITLFIINQISPGQSLIVEKQSGQKQYDIQAIENIRFNLSDSLSRESLSLSTVSGITQIALKTIDSIFFTGSSEINIAIKDSVVRFRTADIDFFSICPITVPDRQVSAIQGSQFITLILNDAVFHREPKIKNRILSGNFPDFLRNMITIKSEFKDLNGILHTVEYDVMPDYLSVGSTDDFCRMPMTPQTAQAIADSFGCILPTRKLVDDIWKHATVHLEPIPYPWSDASITVSRFRDHNRDIEAARIAAGGQLGELIAGIKKDVVICNALKTNPGYVAIYGWHHTTGIPIQPLYTGHFSEYVDYSHGIRLINEIVKIDGTPIRAQDILRDPVMYKLLSDENSPMSQPCYKY